MYDFKDKICFFSVRAIKRLPTVNYREKEKEILDQILGPDRYDSRIRPSGLTNDTSKYELNIYLIFA